MALGRTEDTIFALATPTGRSGIAVIRLSGGDAVVSARKLAGFLPDDVESHRVYYGHLKSVSEDRVLDEVLLTLFLESRSFTGEESVEISCHGNPVIIDEILRELGKSGARHAEPGEFTFRAFMNNRIDLMQAEAVLSVIESQSPFEKENALKQLSGGISTDVSSLRGRILHFMAHIEADIDFSTEGLETIDRAHLAKGLADVAMDLQTLISGYNRGRILQEGFRVVFAGSPNVGKSSLLNSVLGEERAIVTAKPGTTRDLIEAWSEISGVRVSWTDTAGLRATDDEIEEIGIRRVSEALIKADLVLWVLDPEVEISVSAAENLAALVKENSDKLVVLVNKMDLLGFSAGDIRPETATRIFAEKFPALKLANAGDRNTLLLSSTWGAKARELILGKVSERISATGSAQDVVISRARHFEALSKAQALVEEARQAVELGLGAEIIALSLKEALVSVQSVLGERYDEQIIDQIFKEFCLGK